MRQAEVCLYCPALLIHDLCSELSAIVPTGDFNKAVERELPAGDPNGQRSLSSIEAAFNHASIPWPTYGVATLWAPVLSLTATSGLTVVALSCSPTRSASGWLRAMVQSTSFRRNVGLGPKDQTWHHEQWLHLKFTGRKRRRGAFPVDCKPQQKAVLHHKS